MRVFVTGASGFIGSAIVKELIGAGHEVIGLARSDAAAQSLVAAGAKAHCGSIEDVESLRSGVKGADGAIHTAFFHEITHMSLATRLRVLLGGRPTGIMTRFMTTALDTNQQVMETLGGALAGGDRPLVAAFVTTAMAPGHLATEDQTFDPKAAGGQRGKAEETMLALAERGVQTSIIRLPPIVHGKGDKGGFASRLIGIARKKGESGYIGDGSNRWPAVHCLDAAHLFRLALENGVAGSRYHAVGDEGVPFRDIAALIGAKLDVPVVSKTPSEAAKQFSWMAMFLGVDNPTSSQLTQEKLNWRPTHPDLMTDLNQADYFKV